MSKMDTLRIGVLASTRASDLQGIIEAIARGELNAQVAVLVSNKPDAFALQRARDNGIKAVFVDPEGKTREQYDDEVAALFEAEKVRLVLLIGYMRWLSPKFVQAYVNRIMNVHPSLLPAFPGMDKSVHGSVLAAGCKVTGCTVHFVDEGQDTGPIILQKAVEVKDGDTVETLKERVQAAEKECLVKAVGLFGGNKLRVEGRKVLVVP
jgi:phosphoribosylglycinamide formyltransferase-1